MWHIPILWEYVANEIIDKSSLSFGDFALIVANFTSLLNGEKDQESILKGRGYSEEQLKAVGIKQAPARDIFGLRFTEPLVKFKHPRMGYLLTLLENYERGNLPYPGSLSEQPAEAIEILNLLQNLKSEYQKQMRKN